MRTTAVIMLTGLLLMAQSAIAVTTALPQVSGSIARPEGIQVLGFLPHWQVEAAMAALDFDLLTMVAIHGVEASGQGKLVSRKPSGSVPPGWQLLHREDFGAVIERLRAAGIKVLISVQRFGWKERQLQRTTSLLVDPEHRRQLAQRVATLVDEHRLDGVNLDFEPVPPPLADDYVELVREVRTALDGLERDLTLTVDVTTHPGYDLAALTADGAADFVVLLGYDYRDAASSTSGSIAPLHDFRTTDLASSLDEALSKVAADELILALPWYGRAWTTDSGIAHAATVSGSGIDASRALSYAEAAEIATRFGRRYQRQHSSAWTAYPVRECSTCPPVWRQVWYDDPDSFGAKIDFALAHRLAGIGIWALGHEDERAELWWTLRNRLYPHRDTEAPMGSAYLEPDSVSDKRDGRDVVEGYARLRLAASDGARGSGPAFVRIGLSAHVKPDGRLVEGQTYPAAARIEFPLGEPETGGSDLSGRRSIYVQWRDIAGNWSRPLVLKVWVEDPASR